MIEEGESVENDYYVRNADETTVDLPITADVSVTRSLAAAAARTYLERLRIWLRRSPILSRPSSTNIAARVAVLGHRPERRSRRDRRAVPPVTALALWLAWDAARELPNLPLDGRPGRSWIFMRGSKSSRRRDGGSCG